MKKNLRIVSAAAALLAVAPVAATTVSTVNADVVGNSYDQNMGKLDDGTINTTTGTVDLQQIAYKNYNDANAIQYAITNDVKKQLKDNSGNISATIVNEQSNVDPSSAAKSSVTYTFTVKRTGVTLKHENEVVKAKGANHLYWNAKGELLYSASATPAVPDTTTPSESINAGEGTDSIFDADNNLFVTINAVSAQAGRPSAISGNITANIDGQTVTALLHGNANTTIYEKNPLTTKAKRL